MREPGSLSKVYERETDEGFLFVADQLYEERVGEMLDRYDLAPFELAGEQWDVDDREEHARRLPRLYERYGRRKRW